MLERGIDEDGRPGRRALGGGGSTRKEREDKGEKAGVGSAC